MIISSTIPERRWIMTLEHLHPNYVTNDQGEKTAVILPIAEFQQLIEDIEDLAAVAERRDEPTVSHQELLAELKSDGLLSD